MSLINGLVLYIKNDELSGTVANDSSGTGNNGTLIGRDYSTDGVTGQINRALTFSGAGNESIEIPDDISLQITDALTISSWVNLVVNSANTMIEKTIGGAINKQYLLFTDNAGKATFRLIQGAELPTTFQVVSEFALSTSTWIHIVGTWDGSTIKMYIDNVLENTEVSLTDSINSGIGKTFIGLLGNGGFPMNGSIDEVTVWDRALSPAEVTNVFNAGNAGFSFLDVPTGTVISALQRDVDGAIVDITFNLIDNDSNNVTVTLKGSDTGTFTGEEKVLTALTSDLLHTLFIGTPLTASPTGVQYNFVWDAENEYANGFEGPIHLQFTLDNGVVAPFVVPFSSIALSVTYEDLVGDEGEQELELWQTEDPALAAVSTLTEPFNLGEVLRNARTSGTVLTDHQIRTLNVWRDNDIGLFNVGTQLQPFRFGDVLVELLGAPPFTTTLTQEEIDDLNDWANNDASLARVSTLSEPFMLGDVLNTLLTRRF